jgi:6-phosphogluconolactonase (cycloisomerase 2 family)
MSKKEITVFPFSGAGRTAARGFAALGLCATFLLAGCHNFFVCENKPACPSSGSGGTGSTTDFAYVSNSSTGNTYVSEYDLTDGALTTISGSPFNLGFQPVALNITPDNAFLYAATLPGATNAGIYLYTIGSDGALSSSSSSPLISYAVSSMAISPDGDYLFALSSLGTIMTEYQINSSTGALTPALTINVPISTCSLVGTPASQTCSVTAAPGGQFVVVALGTAGDAIFPYSSSTGISSASYTLIPSGSTQSSPSGDFSVVLDDNNFAYIARTQALAVYAISSTGAATQQSNAAYANNDVPRSVVLNTSQNYVFTANEGAGTISSWGIGSSGALTAATGSPFTAPTNVSAIGVDNSGKYMLAAGYNSTSGVQLFSVSSSGVLTLAASAATGTSTAYPVVLAMSH